MLSTPLQILVPFFLSLYLASTLPSSTPDTAKTRSSSHHLYKREVQLIDQCTRPGWGFLASFCIRHSHPESRAYQIICEHPIHHGQVEVSSGHCPHNTVCSDGPPPPQEPGVYQQMLWDTASCIGYENFVRLARLGLGEPAASTTSLYPARASDTDAGSTAVYDLPSSTTHIDTPAPSSGPLTSEPHSLHSRSNHKLAKRTVTFLDSCPSPYTGWQVLFSYCIPRAGGHKSYVIYCRTPRIEPYDIHPQFALINGECGSDEVCVQRPEQGYPSVSTAYCLGYENVFSLATNMLGHSLTTPPTASDSNATSTLPPPPTQTSSTTHNALLLRRADDPLSSRPPDWTFVISYCDPIPGSRSGYRKTCASLAYDDMQAPRLRIVTLTGDCGPYMTCFDAPSPTSPGQLSTTVACDWGTARCLLWEHVERQDEGRWGSSEAHWRGRSRRCTGPNPRLPEGPTEPNPTSHGNSRGRRREDRFWHGVGEMLREFAEEVSEWWSRVHR